MALTYPKRKAFLYSLPSIVVLETANQWPGLDKVSYTPKVDGKEIQYGAGTFGLGYVRGKNSVEGELSFIQEYFFDWVKFHPAYLSIIIPSLVIAYQEGPRQDRVELTEMTFTESGSESEETEGLRTTVPFMALDLKVNGVSVFEKAAADNVSSLGTF